MSRTTDPKLRKLMLYQVYVRNYSEAGTFKALQDDLPRIKALGTDVLYLLPIHPIGEKNRKGELGSPYSIKDYNAINPELGDEADFKALIQATHDHGMQLMMDIVYNHTSYDSVLLEHHPEFFYQNAQGQFTNRVADWWDITDFDYTKDRRLYQVLTDSLVHYTKLGVDGFRFDVASFLPLDFLEEAHAAVKAVNPNTLWLSESVHGHFLRLIRNSGFDCLSESEIYQVFDMAYDYDAHPFFEAYLKGEKPLQSYLDFLILQEEIYPKNYVKMRNLENHDFGRIAHHLQGHQAKLEQWHAFSFFSRGSTMIYMGGEYSALHHPDLFNKDVITKDGKDLSPLIQACAKAVKSDVFTTGVYALEKAPEADVIIGRYDTQDEHVVGLFNVADAQGTMTLHGLSGTYRDLISGDTITLVEGANPIPSQPLILHKR